MGSHPPSPSWLGLALAGGPVLFCMAVLAARGLGQTRPLAVALLRLVVQIALLGYVLEWIFARSSPLTSISAALAMLLFSASTVAARGSTDRSELWGLRLEAFVAILIGVCFTMGFALRLALHVEPWYSTRVLVPLLGMVLGNSVHGVSLAVERLGSEIAGDRDRIELRLALGASARQAALPALRAAVKAGLTPMINGMMIAGIVSVPGMATGQILAGSNVGTALRYQVLVYFLISGTVAVSVMVILGIRMRKYFNQDDQLAPSVEQDARAARPGRG